MGAIVEPPAVLVNSEGDARSPAVDGRLRARFVAVYTQEYPRIVAYAQRRIWDRAAAEDVAAEVFRIAWERISDGVPSTGWLFVTARNLLHAHHRGTERALRLRQRLELQKRNAGEPDDSAGDRVLAALDRLPAEQRELLSAFYWDDLSGAQCAALVGCSPGAVWVRLHRARQALRHQLQNPEDSSCD